VTKCIKLFLTDLDGCLTDGGFYVPSSNNFDLFLKKFNSRDMMGLELLYRSGIKIGIITTSVNVCQNQFSRSCPYATILSGQRHKDKIIKEVYIDKGIAEWSDVAFIGDDINDIDLLKLVGLPACPVNAVPEVQQTVRSHKDGYVSMLRGGESVVRDFADYVRSICNIPAKWE